MNGIGVHWRDGRSLVAVTLESTRMLNYWPNVSVIVVEMTDVSEINCHYASGEHVLHGNSVMRETITKILEIIF